MSLSETLPWVGPLLADAQFRWWLLGIYLAIGPVPEETTKDGVTTSRWKWGGLLRIALIGALGHSRLADRVGSLETAVEQMSAGLTAVIAELRVWRGAGVFSGPVSGASVTRSDSQNIAAGPANPVAGAVGCDEAVPQARRSLTSRPQLSD
jgi:hypothetical protein